MKSSRLSNSGLFLALLVGTTILLGAPAAWALVTADFIPLAPGNSWTYDGTSSNAGSYTVTHSISPTMVNFNGVSTYEMSVSSSGRKLYLLNDQNGYREFGKSVPYGISSITITEDPPTTIAPANLVVGQTWSASSQWTTQGMATASAAVTLSTTAIGYEYVTVPAGTFYAMKISTTKSATVATSDSVSQTSSGTEQGWLVENVGIVKSISDNSDGTSSSLQLTAYSVPPLPPVDPIAPSIPSGLSANAISTSRVNLSWAASTDNVGVTRYKIYRNGVLVASLSVTSFSDVGLTADSMYDYTVAACDAVGNCSALSGTVSTRTSAATSTILQIAAGETHSVALKSDGSLWAWGRNRYGQIGDGTAADSTLPKQVDTGYSAVAAGGDYTVAIKTDGSLWTWGNNSLGQLGNNTTLTLSTRVPTQIDTGYSSVAAGRNFTIALKSDGSLWTWGSNVDGQLGDGTTAMYRWSAPHQIGTGYSSIAAGWHHAVALKSDGSLWAWGDNWAGQLGDGTTTDSRMPKQIGTDYSKIAAGHYHTVALKSDGSLWAWGHNNFGQLGDGTTISRLVPTQIGAGYNAIAAGGSYTIAITSDGGLWAWGSNYNGQLGDGTVTDRHVPKYIATGYASVSLKGEHVLALKSDGSLWAWGDNSYGQLGDGTTTDSHVPEQINLIALLTNAQVNCLLDWGENNYPQLFSPARPASQTSPPYYFRRYSRTGALLGTSSVDQHLYYAGPLSPNGLLDLGAAATWLETAGCL